MLDCVEHIYVHGACQSSAFLPVREPAAPACIMHDFDFSSESEDDPSQPTRKRLIDLVYVVSRSTTTINVEPWYHPTLGSISTRP